MQLRRITTLSLCLLTGYVLLCPNSVTWADAFVRFFVQQKVGQKIAVTGGFRRFPTRPKKQYFMRDSMTGNVEYMGYFGMTMVPTLLVGNGSVSIKASLMDEIPFLSSACGILLRAKTLLRCPSREHDSLLFPLSLRRG